MEIYERVRYLRKDHLKMSQEKFGAALGVNRDVIKNIELNLLVRPEQKEPLYKLICKTFNVSPEWLTTGQGDMYVESREAYFDNLAEQYGLGFYARKVLDFYGSLDDERKNTLELIMKEFVYTMIEAEAQTPANSEDAPPLSVVDSTIERLDIYRAADSATHTEHEVINVPQSKIEKFKTLPKVTKSDEL